MKWFLCFLVAAGSSFALGKTVTGAVTFVATAVPSAGPEWDFDGKGGKVTGQVDAKNLGDLTVALVEFTTDKDRRDEHMRQYLQVATYPTAKLAVKYVDGGNFQGDMTLHGVTKPVGGTLKVKGDHASGHFVIKPSDFGLPKLQLSLVPFLKDVGISVKDEIQVNVEVDAK